MFNPQLYLLAYGRIYSNKGAMTPGVTGETVDGMSLGKIERIIEALRHERYRLSPVKRVHIPKKNGKTAAAGPAAVVGQAGRRGGAPAVGGVLRADVLRPFPRFPSRPGLPHRAARGGQHLDRDDLVHRGRHRRLFRELDHEVMLSTWRRSIHDNRFLRLVRNMLKAGYLEDWVWNATLSGRPQGGVVSPDPVQYLSAQVGRRSSRQF